MIDEDEKTPTVIHAIPVAARSTTLIGLAPRSPSARPGSGTPDTRTTPTPGASRRTLAPLGRASESDATPSRAPSAPPRPEAHKPGNGQPPPLPHPADMRFLRLVQRLSPENRVLLESVALALLESGTTRPDR